ncbi:Pentatricopeptide repeat-containing protein, mitochondrial, partial [Mucuna pruriens]
MWSRILARATRAVAAAAGNYSPIHQRISNPIFLKNPKSTFPKILNPRFLVTDSTLTLDNELPLDSLENDGDKQPTEGDTYEVDVDKLESVLLLLQTSSDGSFESCLDDMDLVLHEQLVTKITETPFVLGENLIRFFRWACSERSLKVTTPMLESLVLAICRNDVRKVEVYSVWDLVKEIGEKESGILNVRILNELILSLSRLGKGKAALEVFDKFEAFQCVPDADTYYFTIEALCQRRAFDWACGVCEKMVDAQTLPDGEKVGAVLTWLCKGKKAKEAHGVYVVAMEKGKRPPMKAFNFLVAKLCGEDETVKLAFKMLEDITAEKRERAIKPFLAVVRALCRIKEVDSAKELVLKMIKDGPPPGNAVFNFVVTAYSKAGEMRQAVEMMRLMESRGLRPDVYTYTVLASAYSNGGEMEEALKIFAEAKKKHVKLDPVMFHTLIRGYCKLEQFDEALKLLAEMKDFGVRPSVDEYDKLIQSLCLKALDWEMAEKLQEEMKENGLHLKGITRGLIRAVKEMEKEVVEAESVTAVAYGIALDNKQFVSSPTADSHGRTKKKAVYKLNYSVFYRNRTLHRCIRLRGKPINYHHSGANRTWYGVPGWASPQFENTVLHNVYCDKILTEQGEDGAFKSNTAFGKFCHGVSKIQRVFISQIGIHETSKFLSNVLSFKHLIHSCRQHLFPRSILIPTNCLSSRKKLQKHNPKSKDIHL